MKNIFIVTVMLSLAFLFSCEKEVLEEEQVQIHQELDPSTSVIKPDVSYYTKANFSIDHKDNTLFEKDALQLINNSTNVVSYHWDFGNGDSSTDSNPSYAYKMHGYYTITLTTTDSAGRVQQSSEEILVLCLFGGGDYDS